MEFSNIIDTLLAPRTLWIALWSGLALLTLALLVLSRSRWGQAKPISKCVMLSVLAHLLLVGYAYKMQLFSEQRLPGTEQPVEITLQVGREIPHNVLERDAPTQPWEQFVTKETTQPPDPDALDRGTKTLDAQPIQRDSLPWLTKEPDLPLDSLPKTASSSPEPETLAPMAAQAASPASAQPIEQARPQRAEPSKVPQPAQQSLDPAAVARINQKPSRQTELSESTRLEQDPASQLNRLAAIANTARPADLAAGLSDQLRQNILADADTMALVRAASVTPKQPAAPSAIGDTQDSQAERPADQAAIQVPPATNSAFATIGQNVPEVYQLRNRSNTADVVRRQGGNVRTMASVDGALTWLLNNQSTDGRWDADVLGAGRKLDVDGRNRGNSGTHADTGITGLALLAFLGAGHTHLEGPHREVVQHGLEFLLRSQTYEGNLAGDAQIYARMYCHGMAAFALSEAYAMTSDERMRPFVERAVAYTVAAQHPTQGGWRYQPGDRGDMSQFGWQVMALKSAQLAGVGIPAHTQQGMNRFLRSVSSGAHGGLASYRAGEQTSRTMTAEALVCRFFLASDREQATVNEAAAYLVEAVPSQEQPNLYYWYYATLGLYQLNDERWDHWNHALKRQLLGSQRTDGTLAGSWDPSTIWGGYGGRAYSTALAALCLEVYYRYLPLYGGASSPATAVSNRK